MITGDLDFVTGFVALAVILGAGAFVMVKYNDPVSNWVQGGLWTAILLYPSAKHFMDKRALVASDMEAMERAYETLSLRPGNLGSIVKICGIAVRYGTPRHAIEAAERALKAYPPSLVADDLRQLRTWKAQYSSNLSVEAITCPQCGLQNYPGEVLCARCKGPYLLYYCRSAWLGGPSLSKLMIVWLFMLLAVISIAIASTNLSRERAILATVGILGFCSVGAWMALVYIKPKK